MAEPITVALMFGAKFLGPPAIVAGKAAYYRYRERRAKRSFTDAHSGAWAYGDESLKPLLLVGESIERLKTTIESERREAHFAELREAIQGVVLVAEPENDRLGEVGIECSPGDAASWMRGVKTHRFELS